MYFSFRLLDPSSDSILFPRLFEILAANMTSIAPTGNSFSEDQKLWLSYIVPAVQEHKCDILLLYAGDALAGYCQYSIRDDVLMVEEVELASRYQRTRLFGKCCRFLLESIPAHVRFIEAYVRKENQNSRRITQKLGLSPIGENASGSSLHYRGDLATIKSRFCV